MELKAREIAATVFVRCKARGISDLSNLKLQKLLYYSQAWHLALEDSPLFSDALEAWVHGPVVPRVFGEYKHNRWSPIAEPIGLPSDLPPVLSHLDRVLDAYGNFSAVELERLTHSEKPWIEARAGLAPDVSSRNEISKDTMKEFYSKLIV
jgi:uncharacterized phage-associated protein